MPSYRGPRYVLSNSGTRFGDVYSVALSANQTGVGALTVVTRYKIANLTVPPGSITSIRLELTGSLSKVYVGPAAPAGDAYDASSLTQMTFGGSAGVTSSNGVKTLSDAAAFTWDKTSDLLVSVYWASGLQQNYLSGGNSATDAYYKVSVDEAAVTDKTGYSTITGAIYCINRIIMDGF